jgi:HSF-type DNA-binding
MLVMLHMDKLHESQCQKESAECRPVAPPAIDWCTRQSGNETDHVIVINDCDRLVNEILPEFGFPSISTESFVRKMYRWGFRQVSGTYSGMYTRPYTRYMYVSGHFRKDNLALLVKMESKTAEKTVRLGASPTKGTKKRTAPEVPVDNNPVKRSKSPLCNTEALIDHTPTKQQGSSEPISIRMHLHLNFDGHFSPAGSNIQQMPEQLLTQQNVNALLALQCSLLRANVMGTSSTSLISHSCPFPITMSARPKAPAVLSKGPANSMKCSPKNTAFFGIMAKQQTIPYIVRLSSCSSIGYSGLSNQEHHSNSRVVPDHLVTMSPLFREIYAQKLMRQQNRIGS